MSSEPKNCQCEVCGARVPVLRRNRCWGCYARWVDNRPVGLGAACAVCNDRRREHLKLVELLRTWVPLCHNCAARATTLSPMPKTLFEIRRELDRDRRDNDRRQGLDDLRPKQAERRGLERRNVGAALDGDMMILGADEMEYLFDDSDDTALEAEPTNPTARGDETRILAAPEEA